MKELLLKYGCNPNQKPAKLAMKDGSELPLEVLNGAPGYINFLDALNSSLAAITAGVALAMMRSTSSLTNLVTMVVQLVVSPLAS